MIATIAILAAIGFAILAAARKVRLDAQDRQLNAICDAMLLYAKHDYTDSHGFVQSLKQILNGDY